MAAKPRENSRGRKERASISVVALFRLFETPSLRVEEALAEKTRATQQRATARDPYDRMGYGPMGSAERPVRLLSVAKLWHARDEFDPARVLRTLAEGRREWPDLTRLIGRSRQRDWDHEARNAAARFRFLEAMTPFELSSLRTRGGMR